MNADAWSEFLGPLASRRCFDYFSDAATEAGLIESGDTKTPLVDQGVVHLGGGDAADFLHAQFCGEIRALAPRTSLLTAWCSPQGRVLFLLRVLRLADGTFALLLPAAQAGALCKRLSMFVFRSAVTIADRSEDWGAVASYGPTGGAASARRTDGREAPPGETSHHGWHAGAATELAAAWAALPGQPIGLAAAALADVRLGRPRLDASLSDRFLPQELNLDLLGGVSFEKGCYPGQEIVARVRFRGSVKRRLQRLTAATAEVPAPGTRLLVTDDPARLRGTVLYGACNAGGHSECLAVCDVDVGTVTLDGRPDVAVTAEILPPPVAS